MTKFKNKSTGVIVEWEKGRARFFSDKLDNLGRPFFILTCTIDTFNRDKDWNNIVITTEDGVDIYKGESVWGVGKDFDIYEVIGCTHISSFDLKFFSNQLAAMKYTEQNKASYTQQQLIEAVNHWSMTEVSWEQIQDYVENRSYGK